MKWFKHMTDASDDAFIEELEEIFGWEGYGRWWKLMEIIGKRMDETDNSFAEHSWVKWQSFLKGKRNKLELFLSHCQDKGRIKLEQNGNILRIICPKLLELRDEYSKKSGHTPDKTPDKLPPKNKEERNKNKEVNNARAENKNFKVSLEELSPDHIRDWLAKKRSEGKYLHHDEHFVLEIFKDYCHANNPKYADYVAAYRSAFTWERCQPGKVSGGNGQKRNENLDRAMSALFEA